MSTKSVNMGIPQGSIIAPIVFNILLYDLPKCISKKLNLVQCADDIAIWINLSLRKRTPKRNVTYLQRIYQAEIDNLNNFMKENSFFFLLLQFRIANNIFLYKTLFVQFSVMFLSMLNFLVYTHDIRVFVSHEAGGFLMSPPCLDSQGCQFDPSFLYLLSCSSAKNPAAIFVLSFSAFGPFSRSVFS